MDMENYTFPTKVITQVNSTMIKQKGMENFIIPTQTIIRGLGKMIKLMGMVSTFPFLEESMKEIGKKTSVMEKARRLGPMALSLKGNTNSMKSQEMGSFSTATETSSLDY